MRVNGYAPIDMEKSGKWMRFLCRVAGVTVKEICAELGISCPQSVYAWFTGRTMPSLDNLYGMSRILNVPMDELVLSEKEVIPDGFKARKTRGEIRLVEYCYRMGAFCR